MRFCRTIPSGLEIEEPFLRTLVFFFSSNTGRLLFPNSGSREDPYSPASPPIRSPIDLFPKLWGRFFSQTRSIWPVPPGVNMPPSSFCAAKGHEALSRRPGTRLFPFFRLSPPPLPADQEIFHATSWSRIDPEDGQRPPPGAPFFTPPPLLLLFPRPIFRRLPLIDNGVPRSMEGGSFYRLLPFFFPFPLAVASRHLIKGWIRERTRSPWFSSFCRLTSGH